MRRRMNYSYWMINHKKKSQNPKPIYIYIYMPIYIHTHIKTKYLYNKYLHPCPSHISIPACLAPKKKSKFPPSPIWIFEKMCVYSFRLLREKQLSTGTYCWLKGGGETVGVRGHAVTTTLAVRANVLGTHAAWRCRQLRFVCRLGAVLPEQRLHLGFAPGVIKRCPTALAEKRRQHTRMYTYRHVCTHSYV